MALVPQTRGPEFILQPSTASILSCLTWVVTVHERLNLGQVHGVICSREQPKNGYNTCNTVFDRIKCCTCICK